MSLWERRRRAVCCRCLGEVCNSVIETAWDDVKGSLKPGPKAALRIAWSQTAAGVRNVWLVEGWMDCI